MYRYLIIPMLLVSTTTATADTAPLTYERVHLSASAGESMENDIVVAILYAQSQSHDVARASNEVNQRITAGLKIAKKRQGVKVQTLEYNTAPVYKSGKPSGMWQVRQAMRLQSDDVQTLSELLGELQNTLALRSLDYQLSLAKRKAVEEQLTRQAIQAFKTRAQLVTEAWGSNRYRLVEMSVSDSGGVPPRPRYRAAEMSLDRAAPTIDAGEQHVTVSIQGTIELLE